MSDNIAKTILIIVFAIALFIGARAITVSTQETAAPARATTSSNTEETYMGLTRQEYLDEVSNNGQDSGMLCTYTYLIDTYGIKETFLMDQRAAKDDTDIDNRVYGALERCM